MTNFLSEHWILSILVTILLGAIGSGLWDTVFRPIAYKIANTIFTLISFGAKRARDNIYKEAARGHHELPSLYILLIILVGVISIMISLQFTLYSKLYNFEPSIGIKIKTCEDKDGIDKLECIKSVIKNEHGTQLHLMVLLSIIISINFIFKFISINRTNLAITYYRQCLKICRPHISEVDFLIIEQKYSMITTKEQYFEILDQFKKIADSNSMELPILYLR